MPPLLTISQLHRRYGRVAALRGIDLVIDKPGVYGFLGPNGAGKTTTIKIVSGLLRPTSGQVAIGGVDVVADPVRSRQHLGVMMESAAFYNHLSGRDNLRVLGRLTGNDNTSEIDRLLEQVGLSGKADQRVGGYSRGMRQRLSLAAALIGDPHLLILDEPANGLDPSGIADMRRWLVDFAAHDSHAVLLSSHQMGEVERICDSVTIIDRGRIVADGPTDSILRPKHTILIRTDRVEDARRTLEHRGDVAKVETVDHRTLRLHADALRPAAVAQALAEQSIDVSEISEERESLEEAFFRLVGERRDVA
ncbi:MAG: hypothetical protein Kow0074_22210 [Candidatus Zixiibacteriota bacterium]